MRVAAVAIGWALLALSGTAVARPSKPPTAPRDSRWSSHERVWFLPTGANLGAALHPGLEGTAPGFVLGAEVSLFTMYGHFGEGPVPSPWAPWGGAYVDGLYDFGNERGRFSFGPEVGYAFFGLDAGPVLQLGGGEVYLGVQARLFITLAGVLSPYVRQGFVPADPLVSRFTEVGTLLKFPVYLD